MYQEIYSLTPKYSRLHPAYKVKDLQMFQVKHGLMPKLSEQPHPTQKVKNLQMFQVKHGLMPKQSEQPHPTQKVKDMHAWQEIRSPTAQQGRQRCPTHRVKDQHARQKMHSLMVGYGGQAVEVGVCWFLGCLPSNVGPSSFTCCAHVLCTWRSQQVDNEVKL